MTKGDTSSPWRDADGRTLGSDATLTVILDGYSAPLTAGNFVDLAQKGAYDGAKVESTESGFCVRVGEGKRGGARRVPLEILLEGERAPVYGATLDEAGVGDLQPALPVTAYGAIAMEHSVEDANDSSARFVMFDIDPRSYTARALGGSVLTGSWAAFGYVLDGSQLLQQMRAGDYIAKCRVVDGIQHYEPHA